MTDEQARENAPPSAAETETAPVAADWARWLAWGWVMLIVLVVLARVTGWADLRAALDLQRLFRP